MKGFITLAFALSASSAFAHRPHIINCETYAGIAKTAATSRDSGTTLQTAQERLKEAHRWDTYYKSYQGLVGDVYSAQNLQGVAPETIYAAAHAACEKHNDNERRTRELD